MRLRSVWMMSTLAVLLLGSAVRAEVKIAIERNEGENATPAFKFATVPAPTASVAASRAKFSIVEGEADENGGDVDLLHDGRLPEEEDQPDHNFFFAAGSAGGRVAVDLGGITEVRQINSYSWHPDTRGPQVYKLYAADGTASGFEARPGKGTDPEKSGWKLLADIDTRPKNGSLGGQYGVSISDSEGALGKYRYLLFEMSATEHDDPFGNTFYSEIDVVGSPPGAETTAPAATKPSAGEQKYEIVIDYSEMPELKDWVENRLRPTLERWYPIIVETLPSENYTAPRRLTVTFEKNGRGVAATGGTHISCAGRWFKANLEGEAVGAVVHELVHVVQRYGRTRGGHENPGWLVEGVADYIRWFKYEPPAVRPHPDPAKARYTDSYRVTAAFLEYVAATKDHEIVVRLNAAMREGRYRPELWKEYTGQTVDELWADYVAHLRAVK